ncbi:MAG TPA: T9SS sorting signal type C domain-containing protein [Flavobacterium sp.]|uniref:Ig-like domain-containing protein n=1 Tax=Flavobacterium sp. TaxID=239 RepID=UPI002DB7A3F1|nr:T9SS sorting signal type C domain-containing protein [Flavobacterium sp.]HEU4788735.1 T9SS sorting signal type C domain-containing protein [Flavobacterium sp.]
MTLISSTTASSPTYQWQSSTTSGIGFTDITVNGTNATYVFPSALTQTTYYRLKIKSTCTVVTNQITITVTLPAIPTAVTPNSGISICNGSSTNVNATSAGNTINWYTVASGGTLLGNSASGANFSVSPSSNTIYYAETKTTAGCLSATRTATALITVNTLSTAPTGATGTTTICNGGSTTLTVAGGSAGTGAGVEWFTGSCGGASAGTGNSITVSPSATTTYYLRYNGTCNTTTCATVTVTVNTLSTAPTGATGTTTICNGGSTTLTVAGGSAGTGASVEWFTGSCGGTSAGTGNSITVSPSATTTYYLRYIGTCNTTTCATVTVTVNPTSNGGSVSGSQTTICLNTSTGVLTLGGGYVGSVVQWEKRLDSEPTWTTISNTSTTYSDIPTVAGVWEYRALVQSGSCPAIYSTSFAVTVESGIPVVPILNSVSLSCNLTSAVGTWAAVSNISNYQFDLSIDPLFGVGTFVGGYQDFPVSLSATSTESVALSGLNANATYYARLRTVSSCGTVSGNSNVVTISVPITTTTDGGLTWNNGQPDNTMKAVFMSTGSIDPITMVTPIDACSCEIGPGVNVVVGTPSGANANADAILKLEKGLHVDDSSTLTFENNASLIQVDDFAVNTGKIIYNRTTTAMKNFDYTYWSSPVQGQTLYDLSPNTLWDKYLSYSLDNKWVVEAYGTSIMFAGKGYIIRVPKPQFWPNPLAADYVQSVKFKGVPNNGKYTLAIAPTGYSNLVGNPYPSAMSADAFLLENSVNNPRVESTIRFWTHSTVITNNKYSGADYASYNYLGGVGTSGNFVDTNGNGIKDVGEVVIAANSPLGNIAAGQSFFVKSATKIEPVVFKNSMRVGVSGKNAQFFRGTKSKTAAIEKHRVWLNLTNSEGAFKQLLVGYATGATNGLDSAFDGLSINSNVYIDFYSVNEGNNFVIQGRAVPFDKTDKVPLGYKTTIEGVFTISINQVDGALTDQPIFIEDKVTNVVHNLKNGPYSFNTVKGTFNDRFMLVYVDKTVVTKRSITVGTSVNSLNPTLENQSIDGKDNSIIVSVKNHQIKINSFEETMSMVMVYDLRGRLLYENNEVNSNEYVIKELNYSDQFLIVMTQLTNGNWITKEIILKN